MHEPPSPEPEGYSPTSVPTPQAVEIQLTKILTAEGFANSGRLRDFLAYVVRQHVSGKAGELKEYPIGVEVFGRPATFDPKADAIVRVTATRLRKELAEYYSTAGKDDSLKISIPTGGYVPQFEVRSVSSHHAAPVEVTEGAPAPSLPETEAPIRRSRRLWIGLAVILALILIVYLWFGPRPRHSPPTLKTSAKPRRLFTTAASEGQSPIRINTGQIHAQLLITPDGKRVYALPHEGRTVTVVDVEDQKVKHIFDLPANPRSAFMSQNGERIYLSSYTPEEGVMVLDTSSDQVVEVIPTGAPAFGIAVTPDEKKLFLAQGYAGLKVIDLKTRDGQVLSPLPCPLYMDIDPARHLLYVSYQCGGPGGSRGHDVVDIYDTDSEKSVGVIKDLPLVGKQPTVSPGGDLVLLDGADACVSPEYDHRGCPSLVTNLFYLWQPSHHRVIATIPGDMAGTAAFFPHGPRLLVLSTAGIVVWDWARQMTVEKLDLPLSRFKDAVITPAGDVALVSTQSTPGLLAFHAEKEQNLLPQHGLANFYSGDGTTDDSQSVSSLKTGPGSSPLYAPGRVGQAFRFSGPGIFLEAEGVSGFCAFCWGPFSESLWVKFESANGEMTILERSSGVALWNHRIYKSQDSHIILQGVNGLLAPIQISSNAPAQAGRWYHIAVVFSQENRIFFYVNGTLQGQPGTIQQLPTEGHAANVFLGASQGKQHFLRGLIDEVAVYNRALSADEVKSIAGFNRMK